jgi:hypothetical protein
MDSEDRSDEFSSGNEDHPLVNGEKAIKLYSVKELG